MKKEALITLAKDETLVFEIQELYVSSTFFSAASLVVHLEKPIYLEIDNKQLNTSIDLSNLNDLVVLHFDEKDKMLGATYVLPKSSGSFGIITQSKRLLFLHFPNTFAIDEVKSVTITKGEI